MAGFYDQGNYDAYTQGSGLPSYGQPSIPPGAVLLNPTLYVIYGPDGKTPMQYGTPGPPTQGSSQSPTTGQNPGNNPYAYTGNNFQTPYSQRFSYPGVPGLSSGPLGGEYGNGQGGSGGGYSGGWTGGTIPQGNPMDPETIKEWLKQYSQTPGADPSAANDPDYWVRTIQGKGGLTQENAGYFGGRIVNPNSGGGGGFGGGQMSYSEMMSGIPGFNAPQFGGYNFSRAGGVNAPNPFQAPEDFSFDPFTGKEFSYGTPVPTDGPSNERFTAPTLSETNDPGYKFRMEQAQQAIQNQASAQGARGGDVMKAMSDYAGNQASQEYGNVYNRSFGQFTEQQQREMALYQQRLAAQQQGWGQAYNTSALNSQNALQAYQTNFNAQDLLHQQNFENAFNVHNQNFNNELNAASLNSQNINAANALGWQVANGTWQNQYEAALAQYQLPFQMGMQMANYNLGAQGQGFNQALAGYNTNYNAFTGTQGQQYSNLYNMANMGMNASNSTNNNLGGYGQNQTNLLTSRGNTLGANYMQNGASWGNALAGMNNGFNTMLVGGSPLNPYGSGSGKGSSPYWNPGMTLEQSQRRYLND